MSTYNVVTLRGNPNIKAGTAGEAITPGSLVDGLTATGVMKHAGAGLNADKTFALSQDYIGQGVTTDIVSGDEMRYASFAIGDEVAAIVAAGAPAIALGDYVQSAGDGTLQKFVPQTVDVGATIAVTVEPLIIVGRAAEAIDNSAGLTYARFKVTIV